MYLPARQQYISRNSRKTEVECLQDIQACTQYEPDC
jgi:hypothetical protein